MSQNGEPCPKDQGRDSASSKLPGRVNRGLSHGKPDLVDPCILHLPEEAEQASPPQASIDFPTCPEFEDIDEPSDYVPFTCKERLLQEWELFKRQAVVLAITLFVLFYGAYMVYRNLAFYRVRVGERLKDLGFEIIPAVGDDYKFLGEVPMYFLNVIIVSCLCACFWKPSIAEPKPYVINIIRRYTCLFAIGHTVRFLTYISTSLPGAADHCLEPEVYDLDPGIPATLTDVFLKRFALNPGNNCGDLIFSGHMFQVINFSLFMNKYAQQALRITEKQHFWLMVFIWFCAAWQPPMIIAARNHYTVDVVVAAYFAPLLWYFYSRAIQPDDLIPHNVNQRQKQRAARLKQVEESASSPIPPSTQSCPYCSHCSSSMQAERPVNLGSERKVHDQGIAERAANIVPKESSPASNDAADTLSVVNTSTVEPNSAVQSRSANISTDSKEKESSDNNGTGSKETTQNEEIELNPIESSQ